MSIKIKKLTKIFYEFLTYIYIGDAFENFRNFYNCLVSDLHVGFAYITFKKSPLFTLGIFECIIRFCGNCFNKPVSKIYRCFCAN